MFFSQTFTLRPALGKNTMLAEVLDMKNTHFWGRMTYERDCSPNNENSVIIYLFHTCMSFFLSFVSKYDILNKVG